MKQKSKTILITFDVEEFDTPLLHKINFPEAEQMRVAKEGLSAIENLLKELDHPPCTFYTTANYALHDTETIQRLSQQHEIASHTFYHSTFKPEDIKKSKQCLEEIIQKPIYGFRMPNMAAFDKALIHEAGYLYDSSFNPTYLPGKYNYLNIPITPYTFHNITEIPASVVPYIRFPLFWLSFKNLPLSLYIQLCNFTLNKTGFLNLYFHPWEFTNLSSFNIPGYIKKPDGQQLLQKLKKLLQYYLAKPDVKFERTVDFCERIGKF